MKKLFLSLIFLLVQILAVQKCIGQTIEYDFNNRDTILGILPFDRPFGIKFTHIDTARVNAIVVRIYQTSITDYKKILNNLPNAGNQRHKPARDKTTAIVITNREVLFAGASLVIKPDSIVKYIDFADSTAYMKSLITLKPSTGYFIEISTHESTPLSEKEKKALARKIAVSPAVVRLINNFALENVRNPETASSDSADIVSIELNNAVEQVVKKANPSYNFHPVDLRAMLAELFTDIANASITLSDIKESFPVLDTTNVAFLPAYIKELDTLKQQLLRTNWYNITKGDAGDYKTLMDVIKTRRAKFAGAPDNSATAKNIDRMMMDIDKAILHKKVILDTLINKILVNHVDKGSAITNTYPREFVKQAEQFIRSDLGLAYVWGIGRVNPYVAAQISLSPLDDSIPLRQYRGLRNQLRSRVSFMIGISVDAIAKDSVRKGLIGSQALILGTGFKLWQWLKLNTGFYLYYSQPQNPLLDKNRYSFKGSPFISLSIDIRVQSLLTGIGNAIFKTQTP